MGKPSLTELKVNGAIYGGWQSMRVHRSIEHISGSFDLATTERWPGQPTATPLRPGNACQVLLDGDPVITGHVDTVETHYDAGSHSIRVTGRDKTGDLVDCSAIYKTGQWHKISIDRLARDLVAPFGIKVVMEVEPGPAFDRHNIEPGETVFDCLERAARLRALLLTSNAEGDLVITRAARELIPDRLVEGVNILTARGEFSWRDRFSIYTVKGQELATDDFYGSHASEVSASVKDEVISRYRPKIVLAEDHGHSHTLRDRAEWERNVRMGRGNLGSITVQGWRHSGGQLWQPNTRVQVVSPLMWLDAPMLIVGCTYMLDERGTRTELSIARPEAFELMEGIGLSKLRKKLHDKERREKRKKEGDDWSLT